MLKMVKLDIAALERPAVHEEPLVMKGGTVFHFVTGGLQSSNALIRFLGSLSSHSLAVAPPRFTVAGEMCGEPRRYDRPSDKNRVIAPAAFVTASESVGK